MAKHIDVEILKSAMLENINIMAKVLGEKNADSYVSVNHVIDLIDGLPAADVQEVVRCKDCKYRRKCGFTYNHEFRDYDYCSYGKRMDGESNA